MPNAKIKIRAPLELGNLIDRAAAVQGVTRADFVLQAVQSAAQQLLLDQESLTVPPEKLDAFKAVVAQPPIDADALRALLIRKAPWEQ